ncbi:MAG: hypothetical protein ACI4MN_05050 [Candidatus Coproplasma sp.]
MKKLFKRASLILLTVCAVFACAFALSACNNMNYTFVIQNEDGSAFTTPNTMTQICVDGDCIMLDLKGYYPDEEGKLVLTQEQINEICNSETDVTKFSFHVTNVEGYALDCEFEIDGAKEYICKLYK